jgi:large subunit ribosomal protein L27
MAHTKSQGSVKGNRDSRPKSLGIKVYGGQKVINGNIIVRQKGSQFKPADGVRMGKDFTLYAIKDGVVDFKTKLGKRFVQIING